jgi:hypothetical protein
VRRALLDVNVLLALLGSDHVDHDRALEWLEAEIGGGWASCALTQNGFVRIISQPRYPRPVSAALAIELLERARGTPITASGRATSASWIPGHRPLPPARAASSSRRVPACLGCESRRTPGQLRSHPPRRLGARRHRTAPDGALSSRPLVCRWGGVPARPWRPNSGLLGVLVPPPGRLHAPAGRASAAPPGDGGEVDVGPAGLAPTGTPGVPPDPAVGEDEGGRQRHADRHVDGQRQEKPEDRVHRVRYLTPSPSAPAGCLGAAPLRRYPDACPDCSWAVARRRAASRAARMSRRGMKDRTGGTRSKL